MKKIYKTVFNYGEADRFGGQLTKVCFVLIFLCLVEVHVTIHFECLIKEIACPNLYF